MLVLVKLKLINQLVRIVFPESILGGYLLHSSSRVSCCVLTPRKQAHLMSPVWSRRNICL